MSQIMITLGRLNEYRPNQDLPAMLATDQVSAVRLNAARWTVDELEKAVAQIRAQRSEVKIVLDLGQKVRINLPRGTIKVNVGQKLRLHLQPNPANRSFLTDLRRITFQSGQEIILRDGKLRGLVISCNQGHSILIRLTEVDEHDPHLRNRSGVMFPSSRMHRSRIDEVEKLLIAVASTLNIEMIATSFVENRQDIERLIKALPAGYLPTIVAKIETEAGVARVEEIINALPKDRGMVMIARGDLFVEVGPVNFPTAQRRLMRTCRRRGVPFIVATGLLGSMQWQPLPTRAEVIDVDQAARSGAAYLMLAEETTPNSAHPLAAINILSKISC